MTQASAPGKLILFGEHAVVYGRPAIAIPLPSLRATAEVSALPNSNRNGIRIHAPDLDSEFWLDEVGRKDPLALAVHSTIETLQVTYPPNLQISIRSDLPMAAGLGSGAAVTVAIIRSLCRHFQRKLRDEKISDLAYQVERIHHGTPSGVDNTVITYEKPVYFIQGEPPSIFRIKNRFNLVLAHSGETTPTSEVVLAVRNRWEKSKQTYNRVFDSISRIVDLAHRALQHGDLSLIGPLMDQNHNQLKSLGVSCRSLDKLVETAKAAGATGAKLSGAGRGGFMISLVDPGTADLVVSALTDAGAQFVFKTEIA